MLDAPRKLLALTALLASSHIAQVFVDFCPFEKVSADVIGWSYRWATPIDMAELIVIDVLNLDGSKVLDRSAPFVAATHRIALKLHTSSHFANCSSLQPSSHFHRFSTAPGSSRRSCTCWRQT